MVTATRGNLGEAAVLKALIRRDFDVLVPFGSGQPYDLVVDLGDKSFLRLQCKTAWPVGRCLTFDCRTTDHGRGRLPYFGVADIFGVYFPPPDSVFLVPADAVPGFQGRLRLEPTRNNQKKGVRLTADFGIDRRDLRRLKQLCSNGSTANDLAANFA